MSNEVNIWYSATELSLLGEQVVAGLPTTMQGCKWRAKKEGWGSREVKGGGGPGGIRTEYQPPTDVLALIQSFLAENPEFFAKSKTRARADQEKPASSNPALQAEAPAMALYRAAAQPGEPHGEIDERVLSGCLAACGVVHGDDFAKLSTAQQLGSAVDFYNLLVRMCHSQGVAIGDMQRLETKGLAEQLGAFVKLGWARKFPPPPPGFFF